MQPSGSRLASLAAPAALLAALAGTGCASPTARPSRAVGAGEACVTISDLAPHVEGLSAVVDTGVWESFYTPTGAVEVDYEYQSAGSGIHLLCAITRNPGQRSAERDMLAMIDALDSFARAEGLSNRPVEGFFSWGEDSRFSVLENQGEPLGNAFLARDGETTFMLLLTGLIFDDADHFAELIAPKLANLDRFVPSFRDARASTAFRIDPPPLFKRLSHDEIASIRWPRNPPEEMWETEDRHSHFTVRLRATRARPLKAGDFLRHTEAALTQTQPGLQVLAREVVPIHGVEWARIEANTLVGGEVFRLLFYATSTRGMFCFVKFQSKAEPVDSDREAFVEAMQTARLD